MAKKIRLKGPGYSVDLLLDGFEKLRTLPAVEADLLERGQRIAEACGEGYEAELAPSARRARVTVFARSIPAQVREARENNLVRKLDAGR